MPLVSIIVNNFNYARFLRRSIDSALSQRHPRVEVIVVDDASTDDSRRVIESYGDRITPVFRQHNSGQASAMNAGFRASRGDVVMFLDADDYLYAHASEVVAAAWRPGTAKVQYRLDLVEESGAKLDVYPPPEVHFDSGNVLPRLLATGRYETTVTSGNAFHRAALEQVMPIPEDEFRISADGYLVSLAAFHGAVQSIEDPLGAYRLHGTNAWATARAAATPGALAERLRRSLSHDAARHRALRAKAQKLGFALDPQPGMRDHLHLEARLASLRLDPAAHPYANDRRATLALRGVAATGSARTTPQRRAILAAWFLALGLVPRPLASRFIAWRFVQGSRPHTVDKVLKAVRRLLR